MALLLSQRRRTDVARSLLVCSAKRFSVRPFRGGDAQVTELTQDTNDNIRVSLTATLMLLATQTLFMGW